MKSRAIKPGRRCALSRREEKMSQSIHAPAHGAAPHRLFVLQ